MLCLSFELLLLAGFICLHVLLVNKWDVNWLDHQSVSSNTACQWRHVLAKIGQINSDANILYLLHFKYLDALGKACQEILINDILRKYTFYISALKSF